jgi:excisionase family DNA binding protein
MRKGQTMRTNAEPKAASDRLMTVEELGEYLGVPVGTLYQWRVKGYGPRGARVGRFVRFRRVDVEAWVLAQRDVA